MIHVVRAFIGMFATLVALAIFAVLPSPAQGLVGSTPAHPPRPSKEAYKQWATEAEPRIRFLRMLYACGLAELYPCVANLYGEALLNQAVDWEEACEYDKAELGFRNAIAVEKDPERLSDFYDFYRLLLWDRQRYADAVSISEECVRRDEQAWGRNDTRLCKDLCNLGSAYRSLALYRIESRDKAAGELLRAQQVASYQRALDIWVKTGRFTYDWNLIAMDLAESQVAAGRLSEAEATWKQALQWHRKYDAGNFWHAGQIYSGISRFYRHEYPGKASQCEPVVEEFLQRWKRNLSDPDEELYFARQVVDGYVLFLEDRHRPAKVKEILALVRKMDALSAH